MHEHTSSRRRRLSVGTGTAALSLGLCLCAGQLISTPAASAATPVTAVQAAAKPRPTNLTNVSTRTLTSGQQVRITVRYYNPKTGKRITSGRVQLQGNRGGKWAAVGTVRVGKNGITNLYTRPSTSVNLRAVFYGNNSYQAYWGSSIRITVRSNAGARVLAEAKSHTGALYKFAAAGPKRFDCSGYTLYVYKKTLGVKLPHKANSQQKYGKAVAKKSAKVGDLIVFRSGSYGYHAGIYAGSGYMYDSPHTGARVGKHKIYGSNYVVRRLAA